MSVSPAMKQLIDNAKKRHGAYASDEVIEFAIKLLVAEVERLRFNAECVDKAIDVLVEITDH